MTTSLSGHRPTAVWSRQFMGGDNLLLSLGYHGLLSLGVEALPHQGDVVLLLLLLLVILHPEGGVDLVQGLVVLHNSEQDVLSSR